MQEKKQLNVNDFSDHLFWDVDRNNLDTEKNFAFILQRILSYGLLHDWNLLYKSFGLKRITEEAKNIRNLDDRSLHFIAHLSGSNLHDFKCYITKQSIPKHWNF
jgi:hypothetical protein